MLSRHGRLSAPVSAVTAACCGSSLPTVRSRGREEERLGELLGLVCSPFIHRGLTSINRSWAWEPREREKRTRRGGAGAGGGRRLDMPSYGVAIAIRPFDSKHTSAGAPADGGKPSTLGHRIDSFPRSPRLQHTTNQKKHRETKNETSSFDEPPWSFGRATWWPGLPLAQWPGLPRAQSSRPPFAQQRRQLFAQKPRPPFAKQPRLPLARPE